MPTPGKIVAFVPITDAARARDFYTGVLGLAFVSDDGFAVVCRNRTAEDTSTGENAAGCDTTVRLVRVQQHTPAPFTILGWETVHIEAEVARLTQAGVAFLRYDFLQQDERGIWSAPSGAIIAWFQDPDGNTLSLTQHVASS